MYECALQATSEANQQKKNPNIFLFYEPFGLIKLQSIGKPALRNYLSRNYVFMFTKLLKNEAEMGKKGSAFPRLP